MEIEEQIDEPIETKNSFKKKLERLINECSIENDSNTPDFILAEYLNNCLRVFGVATEKRDEYFCIDEQNDRDENF